MIDYVRSPDYDKNANVPFNGGADDNSSRKRVSADGSSGGIGGGGSDAAGEGSSVHDADDDDGGGDTPMYKVGMAIIFNKAPLEGEVPKWDYTLRLNYTYGVSQFEDQVRRDAVSH